MDNKKTRIKPKLDLFSFKAGIDLLSEIKGSTTFRVVHLAF